ncbi:MAG: hypothetical protein ACPGZQ_00835 [Flavobacteriaceae bacterium]|nr:hypothetical protein [Flavobacteriaceae bacterium]
MIAESVSGVKHTAQQRPDLRKKINLSLKRMTCPKYRTAILAGLLIGLNCDLWAQGPPPPDGELPIDQHLTILLIAALAIGLYWAFKQIKSQRSRD